MAPLTTLLVVVQFGFTLRESLIPGPTIFFFQFVEGSNGGLDSSMRVKYRNWICNGGPGIISWIGGTPRLPLRDRQ